MQSIFIINLVAGIPVAAHTHTNIHILQESQPQQQEWVNTRIVSSLCTRLNGKAYL